MARPSGGHFGHPSAPLVSARARVPGALAKAQRKGIEPRLFGTAGDLPAVTASGADPAVLLGIPWPARHAAASVATHRELYALLGEFAGLDPQAAETHAAATYGGDPGARDYLDRVEQWVVNGLPDAEVFDTVYGAAGQ